MSFQKQLAKLLPPWWQKRRRTALRRPEVLRKWYSWESVNGKHIKVFYVTSSARPEEVMQIAHGCDKTLDRVATLLGVGPVKRSVRVFLYPDIHSFQRCEQIQGLPFPAITRGCDISLPYRQWERIARTMAHELTHVVTDQLISEKSVRLLDEGLAMYVASQLYRSETSPPVPRLNLSLQALTSYLTFSACVKNQDTCRDTYDHVHSLALYLVHRSGMSSFLKLVRYSMPKGVKEGAERFTAAIRKIYGVDLEELEQQWRQDSAITHDGTMLCWDWVVSAAQIAIRIAQDRAQQHSSTVEAEHLLWAILQDPDSVASCLILQAISTSDILQTLETLFAPAMPENHKPSRWANTTRQCIALAINEARSFNCTYIGTEHLVLGILSQKTNSGCLVLGRYGITWETLHAAVADHYRAKTLSKQV